MFLIATLELSYAGVASFFEVAPKVRALMEANGVRKVKATVHAWAMEGANAYFRAVDALKQDESFAEIVAALAGAVVDERFVFAHDAPYAPR